MTDKTSKKQGLVGGEMKERLRSFAFGGEANQDGEEGAIPGRNANEASKEQPHDIRQDIGNIFAALTKIAGDMEGLAEIRRSTAAVETKLSTLITRIEDVEKRVEFLESAELERQATSATKADVELIWDKLEDLENRSRRNNVRFIGIPEGKEGADTAKFLEELLPGLLTIDGTLEIERAHRVASQQQSRQGDRPRPILAKFLRSSDRERVLRAARIKGKLSWGNNTIMLFPDYARATQMKRDKFRECKKMLHERGVSFRLLFPAKLKIETKDGVKTFECPRKAMAFIEAGA